MQVWILFFWVCGVGAVKDAESTTTPSPTKMASSPPAFLVQVETNQHKDATVSQAELVYGLKLAAKELMAEVVSSPMTFFEFFFGLSIPWWVLIVIGFMIHFLYKKTRNTCDVAFAWWSSSGQVPVFHGTQPAQQAMNFGPSGAGPRPLTNSNKMQWILPGQNRPRPDRKEKEMVLPIRMTSGTQTAIINVGSKGGLLMEFDGVAGVYPDM